MDNKNMVNTEIVLGQYQDGTNLTQRISFHEKYCTNKQGYSNWIFANYKLFSGCSILELGCGTDSFWYNKIQKLPPNTTLILSDFSKGMVKEVEQRFYTANNVKFRQIDIQDIPFTNDEFDIVIANAMLYHVPNLKKAVEEVHRVLKTNGVFYASTFGENGIIRYINTTMKEFDPRISRPENVSFTLQNGISILSACFNESSPYKCVNILSIFRPPIFAC